ncbi:hypothetical protein C0995_000989 [Termitomyces sp. Mi166|nr:hypothetical protein C0995_000989 [Termitomyces sp. Mi166\
MDSESIGAGNDAMNSKHRPYLGMTGTRLNIWVTVACTTAMTLFGYDQGVFGGIIVTPDFLDTMGNPDPTLQGTIVSLYDIGCFFGAMSAFVFGNFYHFCILGPSEDNAGEKTGRKKAFIIGVIVMSIGAILQTCAYSVPQMIVARLITGLGNGINTATAPVWQSETSKPSLRGKLVVFSMIFLDGSITWRFPIAFQLVFSLILLSTVPWLPESPRWLLAHDRYEEGVQVLAALEGNGASAADENIVDHVEEILTAVRAEKETAPSWSDILRGRTGDTGMIQRLVLGAVLQNSVGLSNNLSRLLAACNSVSYLIFSFAGLILIERAGRRKMMIWGAAGQFLCYAFIAGLLSQTDDPVRGRKFGAGATMFFFLYYVFFGICWQITPVGIANLGWKFYLIWMTFNVLFVPLVWLVYPETANRHLEDIDKLYRDNSSLIFVYRNKEATQVERPQRFIDADRERLQVARKHQLQNGTDSGDL